MGSLAVCCGVTSCHRFQQHTTPASLHSMDTRSDISFNGLAFTSHTPIAGPSAYPLAPANKALQADFCFCLFWHVTPPNHGTCSSLLRIEQVRIGRPAMHADLNFSSRGRLHSRPCVHIGACGVHVSIDQGTFRPFRYTWFLMILSLMETCQNSYLFHIYSPSLNCMPFLPTYHSRYYSSSSGFISHQLSSTMTSLGLLRQDRNFVQYCCRAFVTYLVLDSVTNQYMSIFL